MNVKSLLAHKAFLASVATVAVEVAGHFGIRVPGVSTTVVDAALTLVVGFLGFSTDTAAYIKGFVEAAEQGVANAAVDQPAVAAAPTAAA